MPAAAQFQPNTYPEKAPRHLPDLLAAYGVQSTGNHRADLLSTTLNVLIEVPDTDDEVLEVTSGRYDGLRFSAKTGTLLKAKPTPYPEGP